MDMFPAILVQEAPSIANLVHLAKESAQSAMVMVK